MILLGVKTYNLRSFASLELSKEISPDDCKLKKSKRPKVSILNRAMFLFDCEPKATEGSDLKMVTS